jgi:hypothetical protein
MAPWTIPRTGGRSANPPEMSWSTEARSATSQLRTTILAPQLLRPSIWSFALPFSPPLRERRTIFFAPFDTIHLVMLRPRPPVPPIRMYVASSRSKAICFAIRGALKVSVGRVFRFTQLTMTKSSSRGTTTTLPCGPANCTLCRAAARLEIPYTFTSWIGWI